MHKLTKTILELNYICPRVDNYFYPLEV